MIKHCAPGKAITRVGLIALVLFCAGAAAPARAQDAEATPAAGEAKESWSDKVAHTTNHLILPAALGLLGYFLLTRRKVKIILHPERPVAVEMGDKALQTGTGEAGGAGTPSFYFVLGGEGACGDAVEYGADVELIFDYAVLSPQALVELKSERLQTAVEEEERVELGITVITSGFKLRDGVWFRTAEFRRGALAKPVRFPLTAPPTGVGGAHLFITLSLYGCMLYQFPVEVRLVESLAAAPAAGKPVRTLNLDLGEVVTENELAIRRGGARP